MSTAVLEALSTHTETLSADAPAPDWQNPLAKPVQQPSEDVLDITVPRCHITGMTIGKHEKEVVRRAARRARKSNRAGKTRTHYAPKHETRTLTRLQQLQLQNGSIDLKSIKGYKLTEQQKLQVAVIKKQRRRAARHELTAHEPKPMRRKAGSTAAPAEQPYDPFDGPSFYDELDAGTLDFQGVRLVVSTIENITVFIVDGICVIPAT